MNTEQIKKSVVENYGKLAQSASGRIISNLFGCCDAPQAAAEVGRKIGYSPSELSAVPPNANLGVGCGNPSALATIKSGDTVIDLGSGAGFDAFLCAPLVGPGGKVIGVDLSDEMLKLARRNASEDQYQNIEFVKGDIEQVPLKDGIADLVISNCVINLSLDKGAVFKEAYRLLKEDGEISISDIVLEQELPAFIKDSMAGHIACVSGAEELPIYLQYIEEAGFKDITIESKTEFPLELILSDPQVMKLAKQMNFDLLSESAADLARSVKSISVRARK